MEYLSVVAFAGVVILALILGITTFRRSTPIPVAEWTVYGAFAGLLIGLMVGYLIAGRGGLPAGATIGGVIGGALGFTAVRRIADSD